MTLDLGRDLFRPAAGELEAADVRVVNAGSSNGVRRLDCLRIEGDLVFEGDIIVRPATFAHKSSSLDAALLGHGVDDLASLWPGGIVPIAVHQALQAVVEQAIKHWMAGTPLRFPQYHGEESFLSFAPGERSGSEVGHVGGKQIVRLRSDATAGTVVHEIGHALGLWHEHSRSDRDQHVLIHSQNLDARDAVQFDQPIRNAVDIGAYDFDSIMHYPTDAFSTNGLPTITAKNGQPIGQRNGLSAGDIATVRRLYPDLSW